MKNIVSSLAFKFIGLPYVWGGDDPIKGFDCSGFVIELFKSVGILPRKGDWTAETLFVRFKDKKVNYAKEGCLVFFAKNNKINHVEYVYKYGFTIGASGGGSATLTEQDAINHNAYIKMRPKRKGYYAIVNPLK